jgi:hypothetical protein
LRSIAGAAFHVSRITHHASRINFDSPLRFVIRGGGIEANDRFACFGVAEPLSGLALDGFGVVAQGVDRTLQLASDLIPLLDLAVETQDFLAHPFVLPDEGQIPRRKQQETGKEEEQTHNARELAPDAEIDVHREELNMGPDATKADISKFSY